MTEPLIMLAKQDPMANLRLAFSPTRDRAVVCTLFGELGPCYEDRPVATLAS